VTIFALFAVKAGIIAEFLKNLCFEPPFFGG
jgi:hypothetical protein